MGRNQFTTRAIGKRPSLTQYRMRELIIREARPVEWLCSALATGNAPGMDGPDAELTRQERIEIAKFLADKLVSRPKPVLADPNEGAINVTPIGESAAEWIKRLEADSRPRIDASDGPDWDPNGRIYT